MSTKIRLNKKIANFFGYELLKSKTKQPTLESHLPVLFQKLNINCVIDVGANFGQYGLMLRRIGYKGDIISFEPVLGNYQRLEKIAQNYPHWRTHQYALGEKKAQLTINVPQASDLASFHKVNQFGKEQYFNNADTKFTESVQVEALDDVFQEILSNEEKSNIFLKLDTQGYDLEVLKGAKESLDSIKALQSEVSFKSTYENMPTHIEAFTFLKEKGFEITGLYPVGRDENMAIIEMDCIMRNINS